MSVRNTIWHYQAILLWRNKQLLAGMLILIIAGIYGMSYGRHFVTQQQKIIYSLDTALASNKARALENIRQKDTSTKPDNNKVYRPMVSDLITKPKAIFRPSAFSALAVGQKDTYPFYHNVNINNSIHSGVMQEIHNPNKLMAGNFDLTFVFIYLFPLFIIATGYNVLSGEKDLNTYTLLSMQLSVKKLVRYKLLFQFTLVSSIAVLLSFIGFWWNGISVASESTSVINWLLITESYLLFWFGIVYLVASFNWSSAINTLVLGGVWIMLLLLVPSAINNLLTPPDEKELVKSVFERGRETDVHHDLSKLQLIDSFYKLKHPVPIKLDTTQKGNLEFLVATSELINRESNDYASAALKKRQAEFKQVISFNFLNPVFATQYAYNQVAHTELNHYQNYLSAAEAYQAKRRYYVYDFLLNKKDYRTADYLRFPENDFQQPVVKPGSMLIILLPLLLLSILCIIIGTLVQRNAS